VDTGGALLTYKIIINGISPDGSLTGVNQDGKEMIGWVHCNIVFMAEKVQGIELNAYLFNCKTKKWGRVLQTKSVFFSLRWNPAYPDRKPWVESEENTIIFYRLEKIRKVKK